MADLTLAGEFAAADEAQWLRLVEKVLAGRDFARTLTSRTRDGLAVGPLYSQSGPRSGPQSASGRLVTRGAARWTVFQRVDHPVPEEANRLARADLDGGADGLELVFPAAPGAEGHGLGVATLDDLARVLDGVDLARVPIRIDAGYESRPTLILMVALVRRLGIDPAAIDVACQSDAANGLLVVGRLVAGYEAIREWHVEVARALLDAGLNIAPFVADARTVHAVGGSEGQELAYALAAGLEHLRVLEAGGISLEDARSKVTFSLAADADQFATIAKLRAFRLLWDRVGEACGMAPAPARLHAETAWRMMTRRDPWVNLLRSTVAVAAAGLGGADSVTVLPFTSAIGLPDAFARRLARNTQLVLIEEAHLGRVADPASGSGYVEALTTAMAEVAWEEFRRIEGEGGMVASLRSGGFQARVAAVRDARAADVARRREPLTGVSEYPNLTEQPVAVLDVEPGGIGLSGRRLDLPARGDGRFEALVGAMAGGATIADVVATVSGEWERAGALPRVRLAAPFEDLRDWSDAVRAATGTRPRVFLATIGGLAEFAGRAAFARNAFEAGGIEATGGTVFADPAAMAKAFAGSGAAIACLCGTDAAYADRAVPAAEALKAAGAARLWLAGRPGEHGEAFRSAGIDAFIFAGCDILAELADARRTLLAAGAAG